MAILLPAFFLTALLYAMVGFGGGSTYSALLILAGTDYQLLPAVSLSCNIVVVAGGVWHFGRRGALPWSRFWPFMVLSVPMAWVGGSLRISESLFVGLLGLVLLISGIAMLLQTGPRRASVVTMPGAAGQIFAWLAGALIGLLSGIVGIGGGIFLAPLLHLTAWGPAKSIAAASSLFILLNSIAGLGGQLWKLESFARLGELTPYAWLIPAVLLGGQIGSRTGANRLPGQRIRILTGVLVLAVGLRLLYRVITS
ncbi:MAG: sulfite exporter TauE/SafE family protein [Gammaproteobacteria bacterium]|nr:sulfite exporter TauE/SafE family protein [Gammaproteobacteria bacterium]